MVATSSPNTSSGVICSFLARRSDSLTIEAFLDACLARNPLLVFEPPALDVALEASLAEALFWLMMLKVSERLLIFSRFDSNF